MTALRIPDLDGKVYLVTGASTGIGAGVASAFAAQGARVGVHYNASANSAKDVARSIERIGGESFLVGGDMADHAQVVSVVQRTAAHFGRLDGLINNAGSMLGRVPTLESEEDHERAVVDLNSHSVVWACRAAYPWLRKNGGVIINTTSIAARNGGGGGAVIYAAAKGFVSTFTKGFAKEVVNDGIRVNAVSPGTIRTPFHERFSSEAQMESMVSMIPMGRAGVVEDCVGAFLFLASDTLSGYITGQIIEVNGGQLMP
jgi:3-oxoacyl-[acyl-carrier protein] reductase